MQLFNTPTQSSSPYTPAGAGVGAPALGTPLPGQGGGLPMPTGLNVGQNPLAQQLQSQGRNQDSMLVHMTPGEVGGLQALAMAHGGSLSINPNTGLPEAGFLSGLLPLLGGAFLTAISGGALSPLMSAAIVGGGTGIATGDITKGLLAGLGAFGGASLAGAAGIGGHAAAGAAGAGGAGAGAAGTATTEAATQAATQAGTQAATQAGTQAATQAATQAGTQAAGQAAAQQAAQQAAAQQIGQSSLSQIAPGLGQAAPGSVEASFDAAFPGQVAQQTGQAGIIEGANGSMMNVGAPALEPTNLLPPAMGGPAENLASAATNAGGNLAKSGIDAFVDRFQQQAGRSLGNKGFVPGVAGKTSAMKTGLAALGVMTPFMQPPKPTEAPKQEDKYPYKGPYHFAPRTVTFPTATPTTDRGEHMFFSPVNANLLDAQGNLYRGYADGGPVASNQMQAPQAQALQSAPVGEQNYGFSRVMGPGNAMGAGSATTPTDPRALVSQKFGRSQGQPSASPQTQAQYAAPMANAARIMSVPRGERNYGFQPVQRGSIGSTPVSAYSNMGFMPYAEGGEVHLGNGAFVVDARTVSELGNGSSSAGQELLARLGGTPLRGPGDGVSDSIPARIGDNQQARVARDEVKFSPEAVARLGKGNPKRGADKLYSLMDKAHKARKSAKRGQDTGLRRGLATL